MFGKKLKSDENGVGFTPEESATVNTGIVYKVASVLALPKSTSAHLVPVKNLDEASKVVITDIRIESSDADEMATFIEGAEFVLQLVPVLENNEAANPEE